MASFASMGAVIDANGGMETVTAAVAIARIYIDQGMSIEEAALQGGVWADIPRRDLGQVTDILNGKVVA